MKLKRILAVAMATTMVMGMSITAFATETGSTGTGTSEGHVDKKIVDVVVPANSTGAESPFSFVMDPERLIRATVENNAKYEGFTFPAAADDTGVYFKNGTEYKNTSEKLKIVNKGAISQKITVSVEKVDGTSDIGLASAKTTLVDGDDPLLYLGLVCADETKVVGATAQSISVVVPGTDSNYEVKLKADKSGYEYVKKASLSAWKGIELYAEGAVGNKDILATKTAPSLKVTWSFTNPGSSDTDATTGLIDVADNSAPSIATTSYTGDGTADIDVTVSLGAGDLKATGIESITYQSPSGATKTVAATSYTLTGTTLKIDKSVVAAISSAGLEKRDFKVKFNDTAATEITITINIE